MNDPDLSRIANRSPVRKQRARHPQAKTRNQASGISAVAKGERGRGHQVGFTRAEAASRPRKVVERLISKKGDIPPELFFLQGWVTIYAAALPAPTWCTEEFSTGSVCTVGAPCITGPSLAATSWKSPLS